MYVSKNRAPKILKNKIERFEKATDILAFRDFSTTPAVTDGDSRWDSHENAGNLTTRPNNS